ncbi:hypothetical protein G7075_13110 [Phycicoccus sp. HDW14]|uniref:hypothetical protein n=1 Tax=Phycicoccus sp. HDW14 TaxID=2714941 RepID=UPI001409B50D|nr:hypothetical protein [Phycicoccus sp. HDW14]QIM21848.1 hypothetical protein G7075_13110 [Phycicoccus sp. HDW14]
MRTIHAVRTVLAGAAAVLVAASATPQAVAASLEVNNATGIGSHACNVTADGGSAGEACFRRDGDYFYLFSYNPGVRVAVQWRLTDGSRQGLIRWNPTDQYRWGVKNKDFYEYKTVQFRFGVCQGGGCDAVGEVSWQTGWKSSPVA